MPLPHHDLVNMVKYALGYLGHEIAEEHYGVTEDGNRILGVLSLLSNHRPYTDMLGLRNLHDKTMPIGVAFGSRVFVCGDMVFTSEQGREAQVSGGLSIGNALSAVTAHSYNGRTTGMSVAISLIL